MKQILLDEELKTKLLEICNHLFPEYSINKESTYGGIVFHHHDNNCSSKDNPPNWLPGYLYGFKNNGEDGDSYDHASIAIHWFEFCYRYIMPKLDKLYFSKIMDPLDPYSKQNKNKNLEYPENWKDLWENRPFIKYNSNLNGECFKMHPIIWLYKQFNELK